MIVFDDANLDEVLPVAIKGRCTNKYIQTLVVVEWLKERNSRDPDRGNLFQTVVRHCTYKERISKKTSCYKMHEMR